MSEDLDATNDGLDAFKILVAATYVPYSGAISDVSLGTYDLTATDVTVTGVAHVNTITSTVSLSITNNVDMGGLYTVTNLIDPVADSDAVTLGYLSSIVTGLDHGSLNGLGDDDHTQYHNDTRAATWLSAGHETTYNHSNYDTAYGWGDHAGLYDLVGTAASLVGTHESTYNHSNYDTAYGWGDHAGLYDLLGAASSAVGTHESTYNHANYNTAYSWGNHAGLYDVVGTAATAVSTHESTYDHGSFAPSIVTLTNGAETSAAICSAVYMSADGTFLKAKADALATSRVVGLLTEGASGGEAVGVQVSGVMTASTLQWDGATGGSGGLVFDTIYYLSPTTAGLLTATAPTTVGQTVVPVGIGLSSTKMKLLDKTIILL
jgi:hypothetical protein